MIEFYSWPTPNGLKIAIMLEETGLPYTLHPIHIGKGEQKAPAYLEISPNNKIPAIVDTDGPGCAPFPVFESGAILWYLAEKTGSFLPSDPAARSVTLQWLMFQMGSMGPMLGQAHHFRVFGPDEAKAIPYAKTRYTNEAARLYGVMDTRLGRVDYFAGDYSIADIALYPWVASHEHQGQDLADFPNLKRWFEAVGARPAVQAGMAVK